MPQPRRFKKSALLRTRARTAHWTSQASTPTTRSDKLRLRQWHRSAPGSTGDDIPKVDRFSKYNVHPDSPRYDDETYEKNLTDPNWSKTDTDSLVELYRDCSGKWPVIADHYVGETGVDRSMEELKARFYSISATLLSIRTPITSMTAPEYDLYETLNSFDPRKEASRKKLAEGHLYRPKDQVDEETVLLNELQRIMVNQANLDSEREVSTSPNVTNHLIAAVAYTCYSRIYAGGWTNLKRIRADTSTLPRRHSQPYGNSCSPPID